MNILLFAVILVSLQEAPVQEPVDTKITRAQLDKLAIIRQCIEAVQKLEDHGVVLRDNIQQPMDISLENELLEQATIVAGFPIKSYAQLKSLTGGSTPPPTSVERIAGFFNFVNVILILAAILLVVAIGYLLRHYLKDVPVEIWEAVAYGACFILIAGTIRVEPDFQLMTLLPGCLGLIGCLTLTIHTHWEGHRERESALRTAAWILTFMWGSIAIYFGSQVIGFMTIMALMTALGFICGMIPGLAWIGFDDEKLIPTATFAAFNVLVAYIIFHISGISHPAIDIFKLGAQFMGTFVYALGVLIMSWRHYDNGENWIGYNILAFVSGIAALALGNIFGMSFLMGIGGTFFFIYIIEKYYDIPWEGIGWAWSVLGLAGLLYAGVWVAKANPEYFLFIGN